MKKILTILFTLLSVTAFTQSESYKPKTYNLSLTEASGNGPQDNGRYSIGWIVRVTNPDSTDATTIRPALFSIPGSGEVGTDTSKLTAYGPHYWLKNGWNDSIQLGNGTHHPWLITLIPAVQNPAPWHLQAILDTIFLRFPQILRNSVHAAGLSQGNQDWQSLVAYSNSTLSPGDTAMKMIKSLVDLQGEEGVIYDSASTFHQTIYNLPYSFGHWAKAYGGHFLGIEGSADTRNIWHETGSIGDSTGTNGYFAFDTLKAGIHCCWNDMYNPAIVNWTNTSNPTPSAIVIHTTGTLANASTMGNYVYDATHGTNIFQWMLRQGDTTLKGSGCSLSLSVNSQITIALPITSTSLTATAIPSCGGAVTYLWTKTSGPGTTTITGNTTATPTVSGLQAGTYVFLCSATDANSDNQTANDTVVVNAFTPFPAPGHKLEIPGEYLHLHITAAGIPSVSSSNMALMGTSGLGAAGVPRRLDVPTGNYITGSCGLHTGHVVNDSGRVFSWGDNDEGQAGNGTRNDSGFTKPARIAVDALGNDFQGVIGIVDYFTANTDQGVIAWKTNNDTLWLWGALRYGMKGNGTAGDTSLAPYPIVMPGLRKVANVRAGTIILVQATDGTVWSWGGGGLTAPLTNTYANLGYTPTTSATDFRSPKQVTGFGTAATIAGGSAFNFVINTSHELWAWGAFGGYMGDVDNSTAHPLPYKDTAITNHLPAYPTAIETISTCTHIICADSTLYGFGNNPSGELGDGTEPNQATRPFPWNWDPGNIGDYLVRYPTKVTAKHNWVWLSHGMTFVFHNHAEDVNQQTFTSGRAKGVDLAGTKPCGTGLIAADYANAWDRPYMYPDSASAQTTVRAATVEGCITGQLTTDCSDCSLGAANTNLHAIGQGTINTNTLSLILTNSSTTDASHGIITNVWTNLSGNATIEVPGAASTKITFPGPGTYVVKLTITDNQYSKDNTNVTIVVGATDCHCLQLHF